MAEVPFYTLVDNVVVQFHTHAHQRCKPTYLYVL